jgi:hypothetical protein
MKRVMKTGRDSITCLPGPVFPVAGRSGAARPVHNREKAGHVG